MWSEDGAGICLRNAQFEVPILAFFEPIEILSALRSYVSELIYICVSLENLVISQHQALAKVVHISETKQRKLV